MLHLMQNLLLEEASSDSSALNPTQNPPPTTPTWFDNFISGITDWALNTGVKILISLLLLIISFKIINVIGNRIARKSKGEKYDKTVMLIISRFFKITLKILVLICIVAYLGIPTSGFTALVTSFGVCIGLAVNGAVSNLAGGVLIIFTRPFKIDDFIEAQGITGTVEDIGIVNTKVRTLDNKVVYLPNGGLSNSTVINYSEKDMRRVDINFSIGYKNDYKKAEDLIREICEKHEKIEKEPAPFIRIIEHGKSSINIVTRVWTKNSDYWDVYFDLMESVKSAFDENGINIPYDQLDVHVKDDRTSIEK